MRFVLSSKVRRPRLVFVSALSLLACCASGSCAHIALPIASKAASPPATPVLVTPQSARKLSRWNLPGAAPHLVVHYMPWFQIQKSATDATKSWAHWKWMSKGAQHDPEKRLPSGLRDIAAVQYPLIGTYNSWSRNVVRYHLKTAQAAGIQAFLVIWYGPGSDSDAQIPLLLEEAKRIGMRIALCYEEKLNFPDYRTPESRADVVKSATTDLRYALEKYGSHPAYLKRDNLPFVYQFNGWGTGEIGPNYLTPSEWKKVFADLGRPLLYARQNLDDAYHPPIAASYVWWTSNTQQLEDYSRRAAEMVKAKRLEFFMNMVCPGFDDTGVWGWGTAPRKFESAGLSTLKDTFDRAFAGNPELIQIVTWNDFNEGTSIEPTRAKGFQYLDALETWWGSKTQRPVDLHDNRKPFYEYVRSTSATEKAELPARPFDRYVKRQSLAVAVPDYLAKQEKAKEQQQKRDAARP